MLVEILRKVGDPTNKQIEFARAIKLPPVGAIVYAKKTKNATSKQLYAYLEKEAEVVSQDTFKYFYKSEEERLYLEYSGFVKIKETIHQISSGECVTATELKEELKGVSALLEENFDYSEPTKTIKKKEEKEESYYEKPRKTRAKQSAVKGAFFKKVPSGLLGEVVQVIKEGMKKKD